MRFLADEDLDNNILRAIVRRGIPFDVVRVQDVGLSGKPDASVLAWAALNDRIVLSHDANTLVGHALTRLREGQKMPGLIVISRLASIGRILDDLELIMSCSIQREWDGQIAFLPYQ